MPRAAPTVADGRRRGRPAAGAAALALALLVPAARLAAQDEGCLDCHARDTGMLAGGDLPTSRPAGELLVDAALMARSVHGEALSCSDCHIGNEEFPHAADAVTASCASCHADEAAELGASVHGGPAADPARRTAGCADCHGVHDVLPPADRQSRLHPLNVHRACGQCHFGVDPAAASVEELMRDPYTDDVHAEGILRAGLVVSATCVSCHGGHAIRPRGDPESPVSRASIDETCGACHVGVLEEYRRSVHFATNTEGNGHAAATCSDCHAPHAMEHPTDDFRARSIQACTTCHAERAGSFRLSYHGKVSALGFSGRVATCESCHSNHAILPASDPASTIHADRRVETCRQCHADAHASFTEFQVHADPTDGVRFPALNLAWRVMNGLLIGVLALGGLHATLWLVRATADGHWKRRKQSSGRWVRRWPTSYVVYHAWMVTSVLLLAATGLPLHYADQPWATRLMGFFGGPMAAGWVHRVAALALGALFATYLVHLGWRLFVRHERGLFRGPDTMLPRAQDLREMAATVRWMLFLAPRPRYGRWTYWEKFDFWAAFWGLFVIGLSGLMLWFPEQATRLVPGWFLNLAVIIHGIEALLDIAFIFTVHVFHANLRPDKFPMDTMFLTGRVPVEEFQHDRPLEAERAAREGTLASLAADAPTLRLRRVAYALGACALAVGFFFVAMMIVALVTQR